MQALFAIFWHYAGTQQLPASYPLSPYMTVDSSGVVRTAESPGHHMGTCLHWGCNLCKERNVISVLFIQYQDYILLCFQTTTITTDRQHTSGWNGINNTTTIIPLQTTPNYAALREAFLTAFDPQKQKGMIFDSQVSTDFPLKLEYLRAVEKWSIPQVLR